MKFLFTKWNKMESGIFIWKLKNISQNELKIKFLIAEKWNKMENEIFQIYVKNKSFWNEWKTELLDAKLE